MANEKNSEIYRNSGSYAREHGEIEKWRESKAANIACRDAIDKVVAENYDGAHLKTEKILDTPLSAISGASGSSLSLLRRFRRKFMTGDSRTPTRSGRKMYRWLPETSATW